MKNQERDLLKRTLAEACEHLTTAYIALRFTYAEDQYPVFGIRKFYLDTFGKDLEVVYSGYMTASLISEDQEENTDV